MKWPDRVQTIVNTLYSQHVPLAQGTDDDRRALTRMMAEQVAFELGPAWGVKSTSSSSPQGKDVIARLGTPLIGWDWQNGATREPIPYPESIDLTGQHFIPVTPTDHLGGAAPGPLPVAPSDLEPRIAKLETALASDLGPRIAKLAALASDLEPRIAKLEAALAALTQTVDHLRDPARVALLATIDQAHGWLSFQPPDQHGTIRIELREESGQPGPWETVTLVKR